MEPPKLAELRKPWEPLAASCHRCLRVRPGEGLAVRLRRTTHEPHVLNPSDYENVTRVCVCVYMCVYIYIYIFIYLFIKTRAYMHDVLIFA